MTLGIAPRKLWGMRIVAGVLWVFAALAWFSLAAGNAASLWAAVALTAVALAVGALVWLRSQ